VGDQSPRRERPVATLRTKCRARWLRNLRLLSTGREGPFLCPTPVSVRTVTCPRDRCGCTAVRLVRVALVLATVPLREEHGHGIPGRWMPPPLPMSPRGHARPAGPVVLRWTACEPGPRWAFCQYPDDLGFHPSMQVRRLFSGEDWCRRTGARSEERGQRGALATTPRRRDELARHHTPPFRPATVRLALSTRTEPHPASDPHAGTTTVPVARVTISGGSSTSAAEGALSGRARQTTRASNATPRLRRPIRVTVAVTSTTSPA
jgi:hypothetical protein